MSVSSALLDKITLSTNAAKKIWSQLNGLMVLHKPAGVYTEQIMKLLKMTVCEFLNDCPMRKPDPYVEINGDTTKTLSVNVRPSYANNPLVVGPRYQPQDISIFKANLLDVNCSGILVVGINGGCTVAHSLFNSALPKLYKVQGLLGVATEHYFITGKVVEKSKYNHVKHGILDKICASFQSAHQKKMFELCGVDIQSQAAYEMASKGLIRPTVKTVPLIYSIKCVHFAPPHFTLEIVCVNETGNFLKELIHELGLRLNTNATCTKVHCINYSVFNLNHALIKDEWSCPNILEHIQMCNQLIKQILPECQKSPVLLKPTTHAIRM